MLPLSLSALFVFVASSLVAQVDFHSTREIAASCKSLAARHERFASLALETYTGHYTMLAYRSATGSAELHAHEADTFIVESGGATLIEGGEIEKPQTTKPGEIRGSSIRGGKRISLAAGDIAHIPAGVPHWLKLETGDPVCYFVEKTTGQ